MAIFRGEEEPDHNQPKAQPQTSSRFYSRSTRVPDSTPLADQERDQLDTHRQRAGQGPASYYQPASTPSPEADQSKQENRLRKNLQNLRNNTKPKQSGSPMRKQAVLWLIGLFAPTLVGVFLMFLALNTGFQLEHITRITTGIRFAGLHQSISRRAGHVANVVDLEARHGSRIAGTLDRYERTSLVKRVFTGGWSAEKAKIALGNQRYQIKTKRVTRPGWRFGRRVIDYVVYPGQTERHYIRSQADINSFTQRVFVDLRNEGNHGRIFTRATVNYLLGKTNKPLARFRNVINRLRGGEALSPNGIKAAVNKDIADVKRKLNFFANRRRSNLPGLDKHIDGAVDDIGKGTTKASLKSRLKARLKGSFKGLRGLSKVGSLNSFLTYSCIFQEIESLIVEGFRARVGHSQDAAATVLTSASQIKSGEANLQVVADLSRRFEGFEQSAVYKGLVKSETAEAIRNSGNNFSVSFDNAEIFGRKVSTIKSIASKFAVLSEVFEWLPFLPECNTILTPAYQITTTVLELGATVVISFFTGGVGYAVKQAAITAALVGAGRLVTHLTGLGIDELLFNHLIPKLAENASGVDFALSNGQGPRNFANVDYGAHYLKEQQALYEGGSLVQAEAEAARTASYMSELRTQFANKGLLNNLFALDNPFSLATTLAISGPDGRQGVGNQLASFLPGLLSFGPLRVVFSPAEAQATNSELADLLYPGQEYVIAFDGSEVNGLGDFEFLENAEFIESNLSGFRDEYGACLVVDLADFLMLQAGISNGGYDKDFEDKCNTAEARRYKMYYLDCITIEQVALTGAGSSFFSTACQHLLPEDARRDPFNLNAGEGA